MYFIRILRLKFAKFLQHFKNRYEAEILKRMYFGVLKICKYNTIILFNQTQ